VRETSIGEDILPLDVNPFVKHFIDAFDESVGANVVSSVTRHDHPALCGFSLQFISMSVLAGFCQQVDKVCVCPFAALGVPKGHSPIEPSQDYISHKPGLGCEHVVGVKLILHAKEKQIRAHLTHARVLKVFDPKLSGLALKFDIIVEERESVLVACA
jgi:hypothetical protein